MAIELEREIVHSRFLDPMRNDEERLVSIESRVDPLTGQNYVVIPSPIIVKGTFSKPDLSGLIERSLAGCPFCPQVIDKLAMKFTPDFIPEGSIRVGKCCILPQAFPLAIYSAVAVLSSQHFVDLPDFTDELLINAFSACQLYFQRISEYDTRAKYHSIIWNHMPPAGASQVHPHLQCFAEYVPSELPEKLLTSSQRYYQVKGTNFWSDLITQEVNLQDRHIGSTGDICWLSSFTPKSCSGIDVLAIFQEKSAFLDLSRQDLEHFSQGLRRVLHYMSDQGIYSFNLCLYSGIKGENYFWTQARIIPRATIAPVDNSDFNSQQLLMGKYWGFRLPEDICRELKEYF